MSFLNPVNKAWCLEQLCESNYQKLFKLIPDLCDFNRQPAEVVLEQLSLQLRILEQSNHTLTIELSHCFPEACKETLMPAVKVRLYLDAHLAEVLCDHARPSVHQVFKDFSLGREIMHYKWRLNFFLQKWLDHCLTQGYQVNRLPAMA